jgi:hypothetical protein
VIDAVGEVLDGAVLTREELAAAVGAEVGDKGLATALAHSFGSTLKPAAFRGKLCFAPSDGQKVRFARPDQWVRGTLDVPPAEAAMDAIVLRALAVHGPLTRAELTRWWFGKSPEPGRALKRLGAAVATVSIEGEERLVRAEDVAALGGAGAGAGASGDGVVRLLPAFDQYVIAATRHSDALTSGKTSQAGRIYRPQGWITPVICVDGAFAGVWDWERKGARLLVEVEPFAARVPKALRAGVEDEAERLAAFLGGTLELRWA